MACEQLQQHPSAQAIVFNSCNNHGPCTNAKSSPILCIHARPTGWYIPPATTAHVLNRTAPAHWQTQTQPASNTPDFSAQATGCMHGLIGSHEAFSQYGGGHGMFADWQALPAAGCLAYLTAQPRHGPALPPLYPSWVCVLVTTLFPWLQSVCASWLNSTPTPPPAANCHPRPHIRTPVLVT